MGVRIFWSWMPLGWVQSRRISPTGSGSEATWRMPSAMSATRFSLRRRRSIEALVRPFFSASATSAAFASRMSGRRTINSSAIATRTAFLVFESNRARAREAARAFFPIWWICSWRLLMARTACNPNHALRQRPCSGFFHRGRSGHPANRARAERPPRAGGRRGPRCSGR